MSIPRVFEKHFAALLLMLSLPLLFLPKINLYSFKGETAGIRIDDLLLFAFGTIILWGGYTLRKQLTRIEFAVAVIVGFSFLSVVLNYAFVTSGYLHVNASFLYSLRLLEYFLFFYVGVLASRFFQLSTLLKGFLLWNTVLIILQSTQFIGIFNSQGYLAQSNDRMLGIASFGAEIGLLLNLLFCFFLYEEGHPQSRFQKQKHFWLLLPFSILVILSGARIAIAALLLTFLLRTKELVNWRKAGTLALPIFILALTAGSTYYMIYHGTGIASRSEGLLSVSNLELIPLVWDNINLDYDPIGKETIDFADYDASWWMRIHKWCYALKIYVSHPYCWLQGVGPGFAMPALDGGFLRILTELGVVGLMLFGWLAYEIACLSKSLKAMIIAFMVNMIFFDAYLAYKAMSLLFLVAGASFELRPHSPSRRVLPQSPQRTQREAQRIGSP